MHVRRTTNQHTILFTRLDGLLSGILLMFLFCSLLKDSIFRQARKMTKKTIF
uniref:Uncharacterized protein n=1 Tax=Arundo donax TaxID=35708 RepID=A0A0A9GMH3_ARUDO